MSNQIDVINYIQRLRPNVIHLQTNGHGFAM